MNKVVIGAVSALFAVSFLFPSPTSAHTAYTKDRHQQSFPVLKKVKNPEEAGFSSEKLKQVDRLIEQDVASGFSERLPPYNQRRKNREKRSIRIQTEIQRTPSAETSKKNETRYDV
ncbi:hypothetical protein J41TS2_44970 [Bacillus sonorensis]|nr:hypothetical protein J41TS2_44970 [Bacillus sonorensis]